MAILKCPACGTEAPATSTKFRCDCGEPMDVRHEYPEIRSAMFDDRLGAIDGPYQSGVWRFKELVYPALPEDGIVSRPEGNTPLFRSKQIEAYTGLEWVRCKHEGMNPTGSFKDRGMTVAASQAVQSGAKAVVCASTGNTSAAVATYAAIAGIPAVILVPEGKVALGKLTQALAYGARTVLVRGNFDDAMQLVQDASEELGLYLLNSLNPFRVEGQKAIVFEMAQQLGWDPPDWIALPAGNLGNTAAFGKAIVELRHHGLIRKVPRLLSVQAQGASPFARSFERGFDELVPMRPETVATAIRIGDPVSYNRARRSIQTTNGMVISVDDEAILDAKAVVDAAGIGAEPASCASVAGTRRMVEQGVIKPDERVVCVLTGHLLKDPDTTLAYHRSDAARANPAVTIDPTIDALRAVVG